MRYDITPFVNVLTEAKNNIVSTLKTRSPEIMAGTGIVGYFTSLYLMYKQGPKIEKAIKEKNTKEVVKQAAPVAITSALSTVSIIGSVKQSNKKYAAMTAAYTLTDAALTEYKNKVIETIGEKKEAKIKDAIIDDRLERSPLDESMIIETGYGTTICYETLTGRYFRSDINKIKQAVNAVNEIFYKYGDDSIELNSLYYELNLEDNGLGDRICWHRDHGLVRVEYSTHLIESKGIPCLAIEYKDCGIVDRSNGLFIPLDLI